MLSEYQIKCPECGYLKAQHYRELNSLATRLECPKCGLYREGHLPREDEQLERQLQRMAESRLSRFALLNLASSGIRGFWLPVAYVVGVGLYTRDFKLVLILAGFFLMTLIAANPLISRIHNQMSYVARLLQYRYMMDDDLDGILANELTGSDLVHDYEVSVGTLDVEGVKKLDSRYYAYVHWLAAGLRSIGCDRDTVENETIKFKNVIHRTVLKQVSNSQRG